MAIQIRLCTEVQLHFNHFFHSFTSSPYTIRDTYHLRYDVSINNKSVSNFYANKRNKLAQSHKFRARKIQYY